MPPASSGGFLFLTRGLSGILAFVAESRSLAGDHCRSTLECRNLSQLAPSTDSQPVPNSCLYFPSLSSPSSYPACGGLASRNVSTPTPSAQQICSYSSKVNLRFPDNAGTEAAPCRGPTACRLLAVPKTEYHTFRRSATTPSLKSASACGFEKSPPRLGTDLTIEHQAVILNMKRALPADGWPLS